MPFLSNRDKYQPSSATSYFWWCPQHLNQMPRRTIQGARGPHVIYNLSSWEYCLLIIQWLWTMGHCSDAQQGLFLYFWCYGLTESHDWYFHTRWRHFRLDEFFHQGRFRQPCRSEDLHIIYQWDPLCVWEGDHRARNMFPLPVVKSFEVWNLQHRVSGSKKSINNSQTKYKGFTMEFTECTALAQKHKNYVAHCWWGPTTFSWVYNFIDTLYFKLKNGEGSCDMEAWFFAATIYWTILMNLYKTQLIGQECTTTADTITHVALVVYGGC